MIRLSRKLRIYNPMKINKAIDLFLQSLSGVRSQATIRWYNDLLRRFAACFADRLIDEITIYDLRSYRSELVEKRTRYGGGSTHPEEAEGLSPFTIHASIKAVKRFFSWCHEEELIPSNPASRLEVPPLPRKTRKGINDEDADKMIRTAKAHPRDYAILCFVRDTGCRIGGVTSLKISNLNLNSNVDAERLQAVVYEKGAQDRTVYLTPTALKALEAWMEIRPDWVSHDLAFTTYGGKPLTEKGVYEIFRRIAQQANIRENWSPHEWRHRFAKTLLSNGANLQQVSQMLGHKSITVTSQFYGKLAQNQVQEAYQRYYAKPKEEARSSHSIFGTEKAVDQLEEEVDQGQVR